MVAHPRHDAVDILRAVLRTLARNFGQNLVDLLVRGRFRGVRRLVGTSHPLQDRFHVLRLLLGGTPVGHRKMRDLLEGLHRVANAEVDAVVP